MSRLLKTIAAVALLGCAVPGARGFSLMGPFNEAWQVPNIAYNLPGDIGGPKNLGQGYRWNVPTSFYAFDAGFLQYFGSNGVRAVESGVGLMNAVLTNGVSTYSQDLTEFPDAGFGVNPRAEALFLFDVKTATVHFMLEELGLTDSQRYLFTIRDRRTQPGASCPFMIYDVLNWSFDPVTWSQSLYLNGVLYTYFIFEICTGPDPLAQTVNLPVDQTAQQETAQSGFGWGSYGWYATALTKDDVGGLRYLYLPAQQNWESASSNSTFFATNTVGQLLFPSNLTVLADQALTNDPATLQGLYPNLAILDVKTSVTNLRTPVVTASFTNYPWDVVTTNAIHLVFSTNFVNTAQLRYHYTFGNVMQIVLAGPNDWRAVPLANLESAKHWNVVTAQTTSVLLTNQPFGPVGELFLQVSGSSRNFATNIPSGEFIIASTNLCDFRILSAVYTNITPVTNVLVSATNTIIDTNFGPATLFYEQDLVSYFTNHAFFGLPVACVGGGGSPAVRQGIDQMNFVRANFDSLLGRFFEPITNTYHLIEITNGLPVTNWFQRVVVFPDWLFSVADFLEGAIGRQPTANTYNTNNEGLFLAGPGNIEPNMNITFGNLGNMPINVYSPFLIQNGLSQNSALLTNFVWATYDGSTNDPIIYPQGRSIADLENELNYQIVTPSLPDAIIGAAYSVHLDVAGGQAPFTWAPAQGSPPFPDGLSLDNGGTISGTPTALGRGDHTIGVTVTDAANRTRTRFYALIVRDP